MSMACGKRVSLNDRFGSKAEVTGRVINVRQVPIPEVL